MPTRSSFVPLGDRVLIRLDVHDGRTRGGIFVPDTAKHSMTGVIEAVGAGVKSTVLKRGLSVHFTRFAGAVADEVYDGFLCVSETQLSGVYLPEGKVGPRGGSKRKVRKIVRRKR